MTRKNAKHEPRGTRWTWVMWSAAAALLLLPAIAMQFTPEVNWSAADFVVMGAMLAIACGTIELATRMTASLTYRAAVGVAVAAAFLLLWLNLAVGIIGSENNPANLMFGGVLAVAVFGSVLARFRARGMALTMSATALAQAIVGTVAVKNALAHGMTPEPEIAVLTALFSALWLLASWLFWRAAQQQRAA